MDSASKTAGANKAIASTIARGNAHNCSRNTKSLARDAQLAGDRVMTEYYLQFADHYFRVVAETRARFEETRPQRDDWQGDEAEDQVAADATDGDEGGDRLARHGGKTIAIAVTAAADTRPERGERDGTNAMPMNAAMAATMAIAAMTMKPWNRQRSALKCSATVVWQRRHGCQHS